MSGNETIDAAMLALVTAHIGRTLPCMRDIAAVAGGSAARVSHSFTRLTAAGKFIPHGSGNQRYIEVVGVGSTVPRWKGADEGAFVPRSAQASHEPVRVFNFACPRCGARNCARHSPAPLITRAAAAMVLV